MYIYIIYLDLYICSLICTYSARYCVCCGFVHRDYCVFKSFRTVPVPTECGLGSTRFPGTAQVSNDSAVLDGHGCGQFAVR